MVHPVLCGEHQSRFDAIFVDLGLPDHAQKQAPPKTGIRLAFAPVWMHVEESEVGGNPVFQCEAWDVLRDVQLTRSNCQAIGRKSLGIPAHASLRRAA